MKRNATESYVARSSFRLENTPVAYPYTSTPNSILGWCAADPAPRYAPTIARRSSPSITSTTKRAKCLSGSHSSTDGGNKKPVCRSIVRKLLIGNRTCHARINARFYRDPATAVKSDRLLGLEHARSRRAVAPRLTSAPDTPLLAAQ